MRIVARRGGDKEVADPRVSSVDRQQPGSPAGGDRAGEQGPPGRWGRLRSAWHQRLEPAEQSVLIAWGAFTTTFVGVRLLTHRIRDGHGPSGGGVSVGGQHFHHYNLGIVLLALVGAVGLRGAEKHRRHPATAVAYGSALALVVDELALLLDLKDVYWARDGRKSVDAAITLVAGGATFAAGLPFWPHARRALRDRRPTHELGGSRRQPVDVAPVRNRQLD